MAIAGKKVLVTGGAGFIGSHLIDAIVGKCDEIVVVDNLSSGKYEFIKDHIDKGRIKFIKDDLLTMDLSALLNDMDIDLVFHIAANPDVKLGVKDTNVHFDQNITVTYRLLEGMRQVGIKDIVFTSTSTVYGDANIRPTPEDYGPLIPISLYGASKLAAEALIAAYCGTFDFNASIFRFANCVGPRSTHGVTYDFVRKLLENPKRLVILGDGRQTKSYVYISDVIDAILFAMEHTVERCSIFNIGSEDAIDVVTIADIVCNVMELKDVKYEFTGGVDGGRGWKGDVKYMSLSIEKLVTMGWRPKYSSAEAIRLTAQSIYSELKGE